jgi:hypothetical protein
MDARFTATESVEIAVPNQAIPIEHYLRQPQRLVNAIADTNYLESLSKTQFRLKTRPLNFMELYHFQPTVVLKVWAGASGTVYLQSEDCEIRGIDYINNRFSLDIKGKLSPQTIQGQTYLCGKADLTVKVALPPPLWLTPMPLLEIAGNGLLKSVLLRIKQRLSSQIVKDYCLWAESTNLELGRLTDALNIYPVSNV